MYVCKLKGEMIGVDWNDEFEKCMKFLEICEFKYFLIFFFVFIGRFR